MNLHDAHRVQIVDHAVKRDAGKDQKSVSTLDSSKNNGENQSRAPVS